MVRVPAAETLDVLVGGRGVRSSAAQTRAQESGRAASHPVVGGVGEPARLELCRQEFAERGQLRPHVGAVYSLEDISLAHARLETRNNGVRGKIAIAVDPSAHRAS